MDLLLHSGSNSGIVLLRDLIREGGHLDEMTAARLIAYAGAFVKTPNEKLLTELIGLLPGGGETAKLVGGEPLGVYQNAAVLAVAGLIGKTCAPHGCRNFRMEEYQKKFFEKVTCKRMFFKCHFLFPINVSVVYRPASSSSFAEKALYVHALHNTGYGPILEAVLKLASRRAGPDESHSVNDLRVYLISGLKPYRSQTKVRFASCPCFAHLKNLCWILQGISHSSLLDAWTLTPTCMSRNGISLVLASFHLLARSNRHAAFWIPLRDSSILIPGISFSF